LVDRAAVYYYFLILFQATGCASYHTWCLCQARINWESCGRKGIRHKNGGDDGSVSTESLDEVAFSWIIGAFASVIFPLHHQTQKMACNNKNVGYHPVGVPTYLHKQTVGKPSQNTAQHWMIMFSVD